MKRNMIVILFIAIILIGCILYVNFNNQYNINIEMGHYNIKNEKTKNEYLNYLKKAIKPEKLCNFIDNDTIYIDEISNEKTGNDVIEIMKYEAYRKVFIELFDKRKDNFNDYPVTNEFIKKYKTNLFDYFGLSNKDDIIINYQYDDEKKILIVELYDDFKNTEPTSHKTYHFHYTLDNDGNVDNIELKNYEN